MRIMVHIENQDDRAALLTLLEAWRVLICSSLDCGVWAPEMKGGILFWDLDDGTPGDDLASDALILCSSSDQAAVFSYAMHPAAFLRKPFKLAELQAALHNCVELWWDSLDRIELVSDRYRFRLPICNLIWAESTLRGSLVHSTRETIEVREPLATLEKRLPERHFVRCRRGILANLFHAQGLDSGGLLMSDGSVIPLSRQNRSEAAARYRQFCLLRSGEIGDFQDE